MKHISVILTVLVITVFVSGCTTTSPSPAKSSSVSPEWTRPDMVIVPGGSFEMGNNEFARSRPARKVTITESFHIGKYEVTNQQYADMLTYAMEKGYLNKETLTGKGHSRGNASGNSKIPQKYQDFTDEHSQITLSGSVFKAVPGKEKCPVVEVTWHGAAFFCNMLSEKEGLTPLYNLDDWSCQVYGKTGYRLPTEAEWEYVAKYNDGRKYPWGNDGPDTEKANIYRFISDPVEVATTPAGSKSPQGDSKLGVCDMVGNVAEFCNDWYSEDYTAGASVTDPVGPAQELFFNVPFFKQFRPAHVVRGGCFITDPNFRKEYGVPFIIDSVIHPEALNNSYRCYEIDGFSRQVESFRIVKVTATDKTKPQASGPQTR